MATGRRFQQAPTGWVVRGTRRGHFRAARFLLELTRGEDHADAPRPGRASGFGDIEALYCVCHDGRPRGRKAACIRALLGCGACLGCEWASIRLLGYMAA